MPHSLYFHCLRANILLIRSFLIGFTTAYSSMYLSLIPSMLVMIFSVFILSFLSAQERREIAFHLSQLGLTYKLKKEKRMLHEMRKFFIFSLEGQKVLPINWRQGFIPAAVRPLCVDNSI